MTSQHDGDRTRTSIDRALRFVPHDRWVVGGLRDGRLRVMAQKPPSMSGRLGAVRPIYVELSPLARRCLFERHPLAVTSMVAGARDAAAWEESWPAVLYVPVGLPGARPVGLLMLGSRTPHWYTHDEIDGAARLGARLTVMVSVATGPLGRLTPRERRFALLIAQGLSDEEIAMAMALDPGRAERVSGGVLRKLSLRSRHEVRELVPDAALGARPPRV